MKPKLLLGLALVLSGSLAGQLQAEFARETILASAKVERELAARHPQPFRNIEVFDVASSETLAGAGFLVADKEKIIAVTAKHLYADATPTDFIGGKNRLHLKDKIYDAGDILAFTVEGPGRPTFHLMPAKSRLLRAGDTLSVVCHGGVLTGKLTGAGLGLDSLLITGQPVNEALRLSIPGVHDLSGNSGAPIILNETGEVIGVLLGALQMSSETAVDFQLLALEPSEKLPAFAPQTIFSIKTANHPTGRAADFSAIILPPELFALTPGMAITDILKQRPFLPNAQKPGLRGRDYVETLASDYLFNSATYTVIGGRVVELELSSGLPGPTADRVVALFDWFFVTLGKPSEAFSFGEYRNRPGYVSVYCQWTNSQATVILGDFSSSPTNNYVTLLAFPSDTARGKILQSSWSTPISSDVESLKIMVQKLAPKTVPQP